MMKKFAGFLIIAALVAAAALEAQAKEGFSIGVGAAYVSSTSDPLNYSESGSTLPYVATLNGQSMYTMDFGLQLRLDFFSILFSRIDALYSVSVQDSRNTQVSALVGNSWSKYHFFGIYVPFTAGININPSVAGNKFSLYFGVGLSYAYLGMDSTRIITGSLSLSAKNHFRVNCIIPHYLVGIDAMLNDTVGLFFEVQAFSERPIISSDRFYSVSSTWSFTSGTHYRLGFTFKVL